MGINISAIGKMIYMKAKEFFIIKIKIDMRVSLFKGNDRGMVHFIIMIIQNMLDNGNKIKEMV